MKSYGIFFFYGSFVAFLKQHLQFIFVVIVGDRGRLRLRMSYWFYYHQDN